jgi:Cu(I)/Ag(I) efflux system protein CusF
MPITRTLTLTAALAVGLLGAAAPAAAQSAATPTTAAPAAPAAPNTPAMTLAQIRRIDAAAGKITLKHDEIANLEMPPMTMVFQIRDAALLTGLSVGAQVRFLAEKIGGAYVVTAIEVIK